MDRVGVVPLHPGPGRQIGHIFKGADEFRAAIGIAGIIEGIDADVDIMGAEDFRPAQGKAQKYRIAGRHVGNRDNTLHQLVLRHVKICSQGTAAELPQVELHHSMIHRTGPGRIFASLFQLDRMSLAIGETHRIKLKTIGFCYRHTGRRIQPAAIQNHCLLVHPSLQSPASVFNGPQKRARCPVDGSSAGWSFPGPRPGCPW